MTWKSIPTEVQEIIVNQLPDKSDLAKLCRVSKHFRHTTLRSLYKTIEVKAEDEWHLVDLSLAPLLRTLSERPEYLKYIKNVYVSATIHRNVKYRCLHLYETENEDTEAYKEAYEEGYEEEYEEYDEAEEEHDELNLEVTLNDLGSSLLALVHQLRHNSLRSFSWQLGTCVPSELLGASGYLSMTQSQLESLSLITDSWCQLNNGIKQTNKTIPKLDNFKSLRSISWRGIQLRSDFLALRGALEANSKHLKTLELDLIRWTSAELYYHYREWIQDKPQHFLAHDILNLGSQGQKASFPSLKTLSLSGVSYHVAASEMALAFNFSGLRSLKLNKCPHVRNLFEAVLQASQPIQLTSLELVIEAGNLGPSDPLIRFLASFKGLEAFHLLTHDDRISGELWETILLHQQTLKQLVYHERPTKGEGKYDRLILPWNRVLPSSGTLNMGLELEYAGLCCSLSELKLGLGAIVSKETLTLLHIRRTGFDEYKTHMNHIRPSSDSKKFDNERSTEVMDLRNFATWAFGPQGLPRLQVLAHGDFSYRNRYAQQNTLLCRRPNPFLNPTNCTAQAPNATGFKVMTGDDWNRIGNIDAYMEVLEACPVDYLYS